MNNDRDDWRILAKVGGAALTAMLLLSCGRTEPGNAAEDVTHNVAQRRVGQTPRPAIVDVTTVQGRCRVSWTGEPTGSTRDVSGTALLDGALEHLRYLIDTSDRSDVDATVELRSPASTPFRCIGAAMYTVTGAGFSFILLSTDSASPAPVLLSVVQSNRLVPPSFARFNKIGLTNRHVTWNGRASDFRRLGSQVRDAVSRPENYFEIDPTGDTSFADLLAALTVVQRAGVPLAEPDGLKMTDLDRFADALN